MLVKNQIRFDSIENKAALEPPLRELIEFGGKCMIYHTIRI